MKKLTFDHTMTDKGFDFFQCSNGAWTEWCCNKEDFAFRLADIRSRMAKLLNTKRISKHKKKKKETYGKIY